MAQAKHEVVNHHRENENTKVSTLSPDEVRDRNLAAMGKDLGELFTALSNELTFLSWQWSQFADLYLDKKTRFDLMNRVAPFFFWLLQRSWWDEALLAVTRLIAPPKSMGKANLTFQRLPALIADLQLRPEIEALVQAVVTSAAFARAWRNRRIAHRDLDLALKRSAVPLPPANYTDIDKIIEDLATILNRIELRLSNATTIYRKAPITYGATDLLYVLRDGVRREELRQRRLEKGEEYRPEDWDDDAAPI